MLDSAIQAVLQPTLIAGLAARGITGVGVTQNNQPRQFVAPSKPTIFHTFGSRKPWGWPARKDKYNAVTGLFETSSTQVIHTRFQIAGCALVSPANPYAYTSGDLATIANDILMDENNLAAFVAAGFNLFRVQEIPLIWFQDASGQNVAWASFDIIFTHKDVSTTSTGVVTVFNPKIDRV